jgi:hypothetical protein
MRLVVQRKLREVENNLLADFIGVFQQALRRRAEIRQRGVASVALGNLLQTLKELRLAKRVSVRSLMIRHGYVQLVTGRGL